MHDPMNNSPMKHRARLLIALLAASLTIGQALTAHADNSPQPQAKELTKAEIQEEVNRTVDTLRKHASTSTNTHEQELAIAKVEEEMQRDILGLNENLMFNFRDYVSQKVAVKAKGIMTKSEEAYFNYTNSRRANSILYANTPENKRKLQAYFEQFMAEFKEDTL